MRHFLGIVTSLVIVTGCRNPDPRPQGRSAPLPTKGNTLSTPRTSSPTTNTAVLRPVGLPASGRIHSIKAELRFVVIDYTLGGMPPPDSLLYVFRNNEKVGEVRLSGPAMNGFATADILAGFIQVDDEVRVQ